ncbi:MAG: RAD55 family ATPase [Nitrososphaerales archaeon]
MNRNEGDTPSLEVASTYLLDFFATGGRSVLVRGDPGTGKTSLVLQLLDYHSKNGFKSVYMSTRLSAKTLKSHQPWVDVVQGKYGTVPRLEEEQIGFQDSRRMEGVRAISGLRQYLEQVSNPFVALDSWEGLFFESHTLGVEEISKLVEDYDARFVVVTERREQTDLDYLLDGVIVLRRKFHQGMIVREIELKKLRGVSIYQSRFLFTLDSGMFRYLPPISMKQFPESNAMGEPIPDSKEGVCSSGNDRLDSLIDGGFRQGSFNLLEIASDVPVRVTALFLRTVFSNFINNGHQILYVPFVGAAKGQFDELLPNFSKETLHKNVSVMWFDGTGSKKTTALHGDLSQDLDLLHSKVEYMKEDSRKPVLVVFSEDAMEGLYGKESISKELSRSIASLKNNGNVRIQVTSPHSVLLPELKAMCDSSLKIEMIHGTPVMFSTKPSSVLNGIVLDAENNGRLALVPIV